MSAYYVDTSALVKRYVEEAGSAVVLVSSDDERNAAAEAEELTIFNPLH
jgi:predicted nucleic acid-binding protein